MNWETHPNKIIVYFCFESENVSIDSKCPHLNEMLGDYTALLEDGLKPN